MTGFMPMRRAAVVAIAGAIVAWHAPAQAQNNKTVLIPCVCELSGAGAVSGTNYRDGAHIAVNEINAAGGILGHKIVMRDYDTQTNPMVSRALVQKVVDAGAYVVMGTVYSGSTDVNMLVTEHAGVPQITGSEAPDITQKGDPYIFRTSSGSEKDIPALVDYFTQTLKVKKVAVEWVQNDFGKGGHDLFVQAIRKAGVQVVADVPSEQGQVDFSPDVAKIKHSGAQAVFVYINEEEAARFLKEAKKQALTVPLVGDVTLTDQKVIELAGPAAEGAIAHVGLTVSAPVPSIQAFVAKFRKIYHHNTDHNGIKGYIGVYAIKYVTEMVGKFDRKAFAAKMHGLTLDANKYPGMLLTTSWDKTGELSRESFMTQVKGGKAVVIATIPAN